MCTCTLRVVFDKDLYAYGACDYDELYDELYID